MPLTPFSYIDTETEIAQLFYTIPESIFNLIGHTSNAATVKIAPFWQILNVQINIL